MGKVTANQRRDAETKALTSQNVEAAGFSRNKHHTKVRAHGTQCSSRVVYPPWASENGKEYGDSRSRTEVASFQRSVRLPLLGAEQDTPHLLVRR